MARQKKAKQPPKKKYDLVPEDTQEGQEIRDLIHDLRSSVNQHQELRGAKIVPAWMIGKKPDVDGRVVLGKMRKCSELERSLHGADAVLMLNKEHWRVLAEAQRRALVDHELCHLAPALDKNLEQREDGHGRKLWRIRKHDLEEFRGVVKRHGCYIDDIERFVKAAEEARQTPLFPPEKEEATPAPAKRKAKSSESAAAAAQV